MTKQLGEQEFIIVRLRPSAIGGVALMYGVMSSTQNRNLRAQETRSKQVVKGKGMERQSVFGQTYARKQVKEEVDGDGRGRGRCKDRGKGRGRNIGLVPFRFSHRLYVA